MAFDAIIEGALRIVGGFVAEVVVVGVFYWPGWLILRFLTFGRYPPRKPHPHSAEFVAAIGLIGVITCVILVVNRGGAW
jgi:hypothetical protein